MYPFSFSIGLRSVSIFYSGFLEKAELLLLPSIARISQYYKHTEVSEFGPQTMLISPPLVHLL